MSSSISLAGIGKSFTKDKPVLSGINLEIAAGELFFLLGPSGCGKSTLLRIIAGLESPDSGTIGFDGRDITSLPPERRHTAMVFQNYALWPHLSVFENVAFGLRAAHCASSEIAVKVNAALELVRLPGLGDRKIASLSGGQQQRVALARAVAVEPAVLLLDEPLSNLDARLRDTMREEIRRVTKTKGLTAVYVTHDRREALATADRAAIMHNGLLEQCAAPRELYRHPASPFAAEFLGDANFLDGDAEGGVVAAQLGQWRLPAAPDGPVRLMFRPESLRPAAPDAPDGTLRFRGKITGELYAGEYAVYTVAAGGTTLKMLMSPPVDPPPGGDECEFMVAPAAVRVFGA
ncbi:MAG: ABC transporter ATP-binding protein [Victivallaceae bacterium]|nr:ABC transporter ATP-binding protein [Victivallaceae bacterium]